MAIATPGLAVSSSNRLGLSAQPRITISWVSSQAEIPAELFEQCFRSPLEGRFWYKTLENCGLEDQFQFAYAIISFDGQPVGIAPTFLMDVPMKLVAPPAVNTFLEMVPLAGKIFPFLVYQRTLFVGSPCSDEGTVGLLDGVSLSSVAPHLQDAFVQRAAQFKAPMIVWKDFCQDDEPALQSLSESHKLFKTISYPGTRLPIGTGGIEGYYRQLKGSRRHNLNKKIRRSKQKLRLDAQVVQHPEQSVLDEIFALFWQTYERGETKFERLNKLFFHLIAQEDVSWFVLLREPESGKLVAFMLCFRLADRVVNKFIGLDYSIATDTNLYFRLWEAAIEWAISSGAGEFQSGQTGYRAKIDVGHSLVPLTNYCKHRNSVIHSIYKSIAAGISWRTIDRDLAVYLEAHPEDDSAQ